MAEIPLISVLVPVYNDGAFLDGTLASIAAQSCGDFEVIISDDGSTDNSSAIAGEWQARDPRFRLHRNPVNLGMTRNWNQALSRAVAEFVVKLDGDDQMRPRCLERLLEEFRSTPDLYVAYCRTLECDQELEPVSSYLGEHALILNRVKPLQRHLRSGHDWYGLCFADYQLWHSNAQMHRREELLALGGWDDTWGCASDTDLILRVMEQNRPVAHTPYPGIWYRLRAGSVSDRFRKNCWLVWEGFLVHLLSLTRYERSGGKLTPALRKNWWRYWQNLQKLIGEHHSEIAGYPEPQRSNISGALERLTPPPATVRLEGQARQSLWNIRRSLGR
jgi:glycosyltransferase involved in cell wall biosynthesis